MVGRPLTSGQVERRLAGAVALLELHGQLVSLAVLVGRIVVRVSVLLLVLVLLCALVSVWAPTGRRGRQVVVVVLVVIIVAAVCGLLVVLVVNEAVCVVAVVVVVVVGLVVEVFLAWLVEVGGLVWWWCLLVLAAGGHRRRVALDGLHGARGRVRGGRVGGVWEARKGLLLVEVQVARVEYHLARSGLCC